MQPIRLACACIVGLLACSTTAFAFKIEEIESTKGIKAWLVEEHSVPLIAIKFSFDGGAAQDPLGKEGLAHMLSDLLTEGAGDLSAAAFKDRVAELGARLSVSHGRDVIYGGLEALSKRFRDSAELLRLSLVAPRFDAEAVSRVKNQQLNDLALAAKRPTVVARNRWYAETFPGHVYGRPPDGTQESLGRLTRDDIAAHRARLLARDVLRVVIVGDIDKSAAIEAIDRIFGGLAEKAQLTPVAKVEPRPSPAPVVVTEDNPLATAVFGLASLESRDPDFPALQVLNQIIGSGDFDSQLMAEIRVKRGLAYSVKTNLLNDTIAAVLLGGMSTKNENMNDALAIVRKVLADAAQDGPSPSQFENAKLYLTGSYLLDFDTNIKMAGSLLGIWLDGRGPDYLLARNDRINAVTLKDVKRVAERVLKPDQLIVTIVGRPKIQ
jgi:zinc protease